VAGRVYVYKGKPRKEKGGGRHVTRKKPRRFLPNLQHTQALINGLARRVLICTKCLKAGRLVRPPVHSF
jgi:large subunit ribosomal protein L28